MAKVREIGPILRRLFINTLFDSTFMQLGILIGPAFAVAVNLQLVIGTLISSSIALGISTGVSAYESEMIERERKTIELEKALFREMENTEITENYRSYAMILSLVNFATPLACCGIIITPLVLSSFGLLSVSVAAWISIILAMLIVFTAGVYFGRYAKGNPLLKGLRMVGFGILAFVAGYLIQIWIV